MIGIDPHEISQEHFVSLLHKYLIGLEQSVKGSNFIFDYISDYIFEYICNKICLNHVRSYIDYSK